MCRSEELLVQRTVLLWDHTAGNSVLPESRQPLTSVGVQTYQRLLLETAGDKANEWQEVVILGLRASRGTMNQESAVEFTDNNVAQAARIICTLGN